ncbi:MAG: radical SAM protein [Candidatus Omnitrophota bacterium]
MRILLIAYDNGSYIHIFPQGIAYIASVLLKQGHDVELYNQDKFHYSEEHLTRYLDNNRFDFVGLGVIGGYYQYRKLLKISDAINRSRQRPFYMIGGHGPSPEPEYFLKKSGADAAIIGEGEETVIELIESVANRKPLTKIDGIAYLDGKKVVINKRRGLIKDIDSIPFPAYGLFPIDYYRLFRDITMGKSDFMMPILSGRGCTFNCNFCYRMDEGFRPRSEKSIIEEIELLKTQYDINYIDFTDELLMSSEERTVSLCESFIRAGLNIRWKCNGRLNYAKKDVLKLMKESGCVFINYGIEAMDNEVLKNMKKALTVDIIIKGVEGTISAGITPGLNLLFGNIGDTNRTLKKAVDFLIKYDDGAQLRTLRPVTPYPGSPLYYYAIEKGLLKDVKDFYENKHMNSDLPAVNFTELSDDEFHMCLKDANERLLDNYYNKKLLASRRQCEELYVKKNAAFRGFRQT